MWKVKTRPSSCSPGTETNWRSPEAKFDWDIANSKKKDIWLRRQFANSFIKGKMDKHFMTPSGSFFFTKSTDIGNKQLFTCGTNPAQNSAKLKYWTCRFPLFKLKLNSEHDKRRRHFGVHGVGTWFQVRPQASGKRLKKNTAERSLQQLSTGHEDGQLPTQQRSIIRGT
jgi:hypothetical protein